jgi:hypothetical protein
MAALVQAGRQVRCWCTVCKGANRDQSNQSRHYRDAAKGKLPDDAIAAILQAVSRGWAWDPVALQLRHCLRWLAESHHHVHACR